MKKQLAVGRWQLAKKKILFFITIAVFFSPLLWRGGGGEAFSQNISATAKLDSNEFLIGDWIKVHLEVKHPQDVPITWDLSFDSLKGLEVVEIGKADSQLVGNELLEKRTLTLSAFDSGNFQIPPFIFKYKKDNSEEIDSVFTEELAIVVNTLPVDTTQELKPIKDPLDVPFSFAEIQYYVYGLLATILLGWLIFYLYKKFKKKPQAVIEYIPSRPPHEIALEKLKKIEEEKLWQKGEIKLYHTKVTEAVREYIERRFSVLALESTTDEILEKSEIRNLKSEIQIVLREMLVMADLVKFAKANPLPDENEKGLKWAFEFVNETKSPHPNPLPKGEGTVGEMLVDSENKNV